MLKYLNQFISLGKQPSTRKQNQKDRSLRLEQCEDRVLLTVSPYGADDLPALIAAPAVEQAELPILTAEIANEANATETAKAVQITETANLNETSEPLAAASASTNETVILNSETANLVNITVNPDASEDVEGVTYRSTQSALDYVMNATVTQETTFTISLKTGDYNSDTSSLYFYQQTNKNLGNTLAI